MTRKSSKIRRFFKLVSLWSITLLFTFELGLNRFPAVANSQIDSVTSTITQTSYDSTAQQLVKQGREYYRAGQWENALTVWIQAEVTFANQGNILHQAMVLSNLALTYQQLDQLPKAQEAIEYSHHLLDVSPTTSERARIFAQVLNTEATLQLTQGQADQALYTWEQTADLYQQLGEESSVIQSLINQAQALRAMGFYQRAQRILETVKTALDPQPASLIKATGLYNLGNTLRVIGQLEAAETALQESLATAEIIHNSSAINSALFSLGNTARARQTPESLSIALNYYEQAIATANSPIEWTEAQVNRLGLFVETNQLRSSRELWPQIQVYLASHNDQLSYSRAGLYAQLNFAQNLLQLRQITTQNTPDLSIIAKLLARVRQQATDLNDRRSESYALGYLGQLYEQTQQWSDAKNLTEQALSLSKQANAPDISYRWHWQLGRLFKMQGDRQKAIEAYTNAVDSLQVIRQDLVVINPDIQFSFKESVEPVYRDLVSLLVQESQTKFSSNAQKSNLPNLELARKVLESLQVAELDDFFKQACLEVTSVIVDDVNPKTGILYAIDLENQIGVILSLPGQPLRYYSTPISKDRRDEALDQLQKVLYEDPIQRQRFDIDAVLLPLAKEIYSWLINADAKNALANSGVETLAFVLDGSLRNLPTAVLHDGEQFLIQNYSLALSPGLQLLNPKRLQRGQMRALSAGLSKRVSSDFPPLKNVDDELTLVQAKAPGIKLLNEEFTKADIQAELDQSYFPIVHLATHGQFSSNAEDTFILTWRRDNQNDDGRINVNELQELLQSRDLTGQEAIELLVLSACQTAEGDKRATLGLAGVAFRAGARSTVATLWPVSDEATTIFMEKFYQGLANRNITKAEALRQAQLTLLQQPKFEHPFFWAPYTLIGNWL